MLYRFKSKAGADVLMLSGHAVPVLQCWQRDPAKPGIIEHGDMSLAIQQLEVALDIDEQRRAKQSGQSTDSPDQDADERADVSLRQRCWPLLELMRASERAKADLVWGV